MIFISFNIVIFRYKNLSGDIHIISKALSLPVLEPLTEDRISKLMKITLSCIYASISVATATSILGLSSNPQLKGSNVKDDESENSAVSIVETSVCICNYYYYPMKSWLICTFVFYY